MGHCLVTDRRETTRLGLHGLDCLVQPAYFFLQPAKLYRHLLEFVRLFEVSGTAVGGIKAGQIKVTTPLTGSFAVALYLASLTFIAVVC